MNPAEAMPAASGAAMNADTVVVVHQLSAGTLFWSWSVLFMAAVLAVVVHAAIYGERNK